MTNLTATGFSAIIDSEHLQNQWDNKHIKHLANAKQCLNAPSEVQKQVLIYLAGKNAGDTLGQKISHLKSLMKHGISLISNCKRRRNSKGWWTSMEARFMILMSWRKSPEKKCQ